MKIFDSLTLSPWAMLGSVFAGVLVGLALMLLC